jgi:ribosomal protein S6E (S10)
MEKFDFYSQNFQFNIKRGEKKKKTLTGALISISIIGLTLAYAIYLIIVFSKK